MRATTSHAFLAQFRQCLALLIAERGVEGFGGGPHFAQVSKPVLHAAPEVIEHDRWVLRFTEVGTLLIFAGLANALEG